MVGGVGVGGVGGSGDGIDKGLSLIGFLPFHIEPDLDPALFFEFDLRQGDCDAQEVVL